MKTNIAKQSEKYPNHCLLVHNLQTTNQQKKGKKGEKVLGGCKHRPKNKTRTKHNIVWVWRTHF